MHLFLSLPYLAFNLKCQFKIDSIVSCNIHLLMKINACFSDVKDLIALDDVMESELRLGPNGGLMYCME